MKYAHLVLAVASGIGSPALAIEQAATPDNEGAGARAVVEGVEEIVVTAQKRAENLQRVPVAVSAVTASTLAESQIKNVLDIKTVVPALNITSSAGYLTSSLRGIGTNGFGAGIENPVALYVDGVYIGSPAASLLTLNNVERIEVLKGPQGTLFGRNATGGLIQILTREPGGALSGSVNFSFDNFETITSSAYAGGPLTETLSADIATSISSQGEGWGINRSSGRDVYKVDHDLAVRSKFVFTPGPETKFTLAVDHINHRDSMLAYRVYPGTRPGFAALPGQPAFNSFPSIGYDTDTDIQPFYKVSGTGGSIRIEQSVGDVDLMSLTAFRKSSLDVRFDYDGTSQPIESIAYSQRDRQFSQEFQATSSDAGRLKWLVGAFYFQARAKLDPFELTANDLGVRVSLVSKQKTESVAGYAQATYAVSDHTGLTFGARYTTEKRSAFDGATDVFVIPLALSLPTAVAPPASKTFNKFTFRASIDHRVSDQVFTYASFNRGFKSGGFNTSAPGTPPFEPETLDAYEAGIKTDLLDRRIRFNAAGFYYDYSNIQVQQLNAGALTIINGAKARVYGVEMELEARVTREWRIKAGIDLINAKFRSFPNCPTSTAGGGVPVILASCAGNTLPLASSTVASLSSTYAIPLAAGSLDLNGTAYYNSGFFPESDNVLQQDDYVTLGASATYRFETGLSIGLFGRNLTNSRVLNFASTLPIGTSVAFYQAPRAYGVNVGFKF